MTLALDGTLVMAGAGKMGGALLSGLLARGLDPSHVIVQDPAPSVEVGALLERHDICWSPALAKLDVPPAVLLMAVKPQVMDDVFASLSRWASSDTLVVSIAAGRALASFERHLPSGTGVVRAMPNTPAAVGRGMTVCVGNAHVSARHRATADALLGALGKVAWVEDEALMDAVTAVSGSGPAYVFLVTELLAEAGRKAGLDAVLSAHLARETVIGAGALLECSEEDASHLRRNVASPGGTTAAALEVFMEDDRLGRLIDAAVRAAADRGRELSK